MWNGNSQRISRLEADLASLSTSTATLQSTVKAHVDYCTKDREDEKQQRNQEHRDNQTAISNLGDRLDTAIEGQRKFTNKIMIGVISVLLTVLGFIAAQTFHFKVTLGDASPYTVNSSAPPPT